MTKTTYTSPSKPEKCFQCYLSNTCMLLAAQNTKNCLGGFKDHKHHVEVVAYEFKEKK